MYDIFDLYHVVINSLLLFLGNLWTPHMEGGWHVGTAVGLPWP